MSHDSSLFSPCVSYYTFVKEELLKQHQYFLVQEREIISVLLHHPLSLLAPACVHVNLLRCSYDVCLRRWTESEVRQAFRAYKKRANVVMGEDVQWMTGNKANMRQGMEMFPFLQMYELSTPKKILEVVSEGYSWLIKMSLASLLLHIIFTFNINFRLFIVSFSLLILRFMYWTCIWKI